MLQLTIESSRKCGVNEIDISQQNKTISSFHQLCKKKLIHFHYISITLRKEKWLKLQKKKKKKLLEKDVWRWSEVRHHRLKQKTKSINSQKMHITHAWNQIVSLSPHTINVCVCVCVILFKGAREELIHL